MNVSWLLLISYDARVFSNAPTLLRRTGTAGARGTCSFQHRLLAPVPIRMVLLVQHPAVEAILTKAFRVRQDAHAQLARIAAGEECRIFVDDWIGVVGVVALVRRPLVLAVQVDGTLADCGSGWVAGRIGVGEIGAQLRDEVLDVRPHFRAGHVSHQLPSSGIASIVFGVSPKERGGDGVRGGEESKREGVLHGGVTIVDEQAEERSRVALSACKFMRDRTIEVS